MFGHGYRVTDSWDEAPGPSSGAIASAVVDINPIQVGTPNANAIRVGTLGASTGTVGLFSGWFRLNTTGGIQVLMQLKDGAGGFVLQVWVDAAGWKLYASGGGSAISVYRQVGGGAGVDISSWHHILWAYNVVSNSYPVYIDDVLRTTSPVTSEPGNDISYSNIANSYMWIQTNNTARQFEGCTAAIWCSTETLDITAEANRRKFITAAGKPAALGANGELPTGTPPMIYMNGDTTNWLVNSGSGGNFTQHLGGPPTVCATSPLD